MRRLCFVIVVIVCLAVPFQSDQVFGDQYGHTGSLIFLIKSNKPKYQQGEPIIITVMLKNHTTVPLLVHNRFNPFHDIEWDIFYDSFGNIPIKTVPPEPLTPKDFVRLEPGNEVARQFPDLLEIVNAPLKEGRYAIRLSYRNKEVQKKSETETWTGLTVTNLLWIQIMPSEKV